MKKLFSFLVFAAFLTACGNNAANMEAEIQKAKQRTLDSLKTVDSLKAISAAQQKSLDSMKAVAAAKQQQQHERRSYRVASRYAYAE